MHFSASSNDQCKEAGHPGSFNINRILYGWGSVMGTIVQANTDSDKVHCKILSNRQIEANKKKSDC